MHIRSAFWLNTIESSMCNVTTSDDTHTIYTHTHCVTKLSQARWQYHRTFTMACTAIDHIRKWMNAHGYKNCDFVRVQWIEYKGFYEVNWAKFSIDSWWFCMRARSSKNCQHCKKIERKLDTKRNAQLLLSFSVKKNRITREYVMHNWYP